MNGLLVRVGADLSRGGGNWNGPLDGRAAEFTYVPIPEGAAVYPGLEKPYSSLTASLQRFGVRLPPHLSALNMHLDPDFAELTYGDRGQRAQQLQAHLKPDDIIVFYAALSDTLARRPLSYGLVGLFVVERIIPATSIPTSRRDINAHSRRILSPAAEDVVVIARPQRSGRLQRFIPIGEYRNRAYRVRKDILDAWGNISARDGYLQRSARPPRFLDAVRFMRWFEQHDPQLVRSNN